MSEKNACSCKAGSSGKAEIEVHLPNQLHPPIIQACPALRAPGSNRAFHRARHPSRSSRKKELKQLPSWKSQIIGYRRSSHARARLGADLEQLYADGKNAEILARGGCLHAQRRGRQFHRRAGALRRGAHLLACLAERMLSGPISRDRFASCCRSERGPRQTDELIDAVVYMLYGLTEEEIGIMEARGDSK